MKETDLNPGARIGFMQGRLSPLVDGRIQAFPWTHWREEFDAAQSLGLCLMEWTLDQDRLYDNPLLREDGREEIRALSERYELRIASLTGDCFMQAPFWKAVGAQREQRLTDFRAVVTACSAVGICFAVVPLVDNGRLESRIQEDDLIASLNEMQPYFVARGVQIVFESDFPPVDLARLIDRLDPTVFGINYDIGNSAALGFDAAEEIGSYGRRILNVHVKDRLLGGTTVALGTGNADFDKVFAGLGKIAYRGNYILQTARATDGDHTDVLNRFRNMTLAWMERHGA